MSLINDALKRARESQRQGPPPGVPALAPVVHSPRGGGAGWMLALAAVLFLAAACLFIGIAIFKRPAAPVEISKAPEISSPPAEPLPPPVSNAPPAMTDTNPPPAPVELLPKVQGVIFNAANPVAIVNARAVGVGDHVGDYRVKQILKASVVFERLDGSQTTVKIGQ